MKEVAERIVRHIAERRLPSNVTPTGAELLELLESREGRRELLEAARRIMAPDTGTGTGLYQAHFDGGKLRYVELRAGSYREAYAKATHLLEEGEVLRGVVRIDESAGMPL